jgi:DNA-binding XRE family transcriptional regulator
MSTAVPPPPPNFALKLKAWRSDNDYTQKEAAQKLGISKRTYENWEQSRSHPQNVGLITMLMHIKNTP